MILSGWELERRYVFCVLYCLDTGKDLATYTTATPPLSDEEKVELVGAIGVDIATEATLEAAASALKFASLQLSEAHLAAGAVTVPTPSAGQYSALETDLDRLSLYVKRDQATAALSGFLAGAAQAIHGLNRA